MAMANLSPFGGFTLSTLSRDWRLPILKTYQRLSGRALLRRFQELMASQWFDQAALEQLQREKLRRLLRHAYRYVPYYRRTFDELGVSADELAASPATFRKLPVLTKNYVRTHRADFITTEPRLRRTLHEHATSGSTGEPFAFLEDHNYRDYVTAGIWRHLTWSGWHLGEPMGFLWGEPVGEPLSHRARALVMDWMLNRFRVNAYDLSNENLARLVRKVRRYHPRLLFGYTTALTLFARYVAQHQLDDIRFAAVYTTGETLYQHQRALLERTFHCEVFNRYATVEVGGIACECSEHNGLHVNMESCYTELLLHGQPVPAGEEGELVVTNLDNYGFPLIRYRLADVVRMKPANYRCACGRVGPMLESVEGRVVDLFPTVTGGLVWGDLEGSILGYQGVQQSQVIQKELDLIIVRIVRGPDFDPELLQQIEDRIKRMMGAATRVHFEFPDTIPMHPSGKFRYAYSEVPREDWL